MQKFKKIIAAALAATMVMGSSMIALADEDTIITTLPTTGQSSTGSGAKEGHVNKEVIKIKMPTVLSGESSPFNYTIDPERLVYTTGGRNPETKKYTDNAKKQGVYFSVSSGDYNYDNESAPIKVTSMSSIDIDLTVEVEVVANNAATDIPVVEKLDETKGTTKADAQLELTLKVGNESKAIKADEAVEQKVTIAAKTGNFNTTVSDGNYVYTASDDAEWNFASFSLVGRTRETQIDDTVTAPSIVVTWKFDKTPKEAAPKVATANVTMRVGADTEILVDLGTGALAANGVKSVSYTAGGQEYAFGDDEFSFSDGKLTLSHSKSDIWLNNGVTSREVTVTFDDSAETAATATLTKE